MTSTPLAISFGSRAIGPGHPVVVIGEIGINHEGDPEKCSLLIDAAHAAGVDAVKLQTIDPDENYVRNTKSWELFRKAELTREQTAGIFGYAKSKGLEVLTTAGDFTTIDWINQLDPAAHKISSGLLTSHPVIRHAAQSGRPLLLSTGLSELADVDVAIEVCRGAGAKEFAVFQCTSLYPAPPETLNLASIRWLSDRYQCPAGLSDHSEGSYASVLSVAAGAHMIEKHITLDSTREGFDHAISLEPKELTKLVKEIRRAEVVLGDPGKKIVSDERDKARLFRRILVARRDIVAGEVFDESNLGMKRPFPNTQGLEPSYYEHVIGRRAARDIAKDDPIVRDAIQGTL